MHSPTSLPRPPSADTNTAAWGLLSLVTSAPDGYDHSFAPLDGIFVSEDGRGWNPVFGAGFTEPNNEADDDEDDIHVVDADSDSGSDEERDQESDEDPESDEEQDRQNTAQDHNFHSHMLYSEQAAILQSLREELDRMGQSGLTDVESGDDEEEEDDDYEPSENGWKKHEEDSRTLQSVRQELDLMGQGSRDLRDKRASSENAWRELEGDLRKSRHSDEGHGHHGHGRGRRIERESAPPPPEPVPILITPPATGKRRSLLDDFRAHAPLQNTDPEEEEEERVREKRAKPVKRARFAEPEGDTLRTKETKNTKEISTLTPPVTVPKLKTPEKKGAGGAAANSSISPAIPPRLINLLSKEQQAAAKEGAVRTKTNITRKMSVGFLGRGDRGASPSPSPDETEAEAREHLASQRTELLKKIAKKVKATNNRLEQGGLGEGERRKLLQNRVRLVRRQKLLRGTGI